MSDPRRQQILNLRAQGLGWRRVVRETGIPYTTVRRLADPEYAERMRRMSREAKRRRTGECVDCGAVTRYNGHDVGVSERCPGCAAVKKGRDHKVWTRDVLIERIQEWDRIYGEPPAQPDWCPTKARQMGDTWRALRFENDDRWPWFTSIVREFGSWNAGIQAAGFTPRASGGGNGNIARRRDWSVAA